MQHSLPLSVNFSFLSAKNLQTHGQLFRSYPVAFEARAELRDSLAFTSMMQYSIEVGWRANWMLHSPTMPKWRTTLIEVRLNIWNSALESVWAGATTTESPVYPRSTHYLVAYWNNQLQQLNHLLAWCKTQNSLRVCWDIYVKSSIPPIPVSPCYSDTVLLETSLTFPKFIYLISSYQGFNHLLTRMTSTSLLFISNYFSSSSFHRILSLRLAHQLAFCISSLSILTSLIIAPYICNLSLHPFCLQTRSDLHCLQKSSPNVVRGPYKASLSFFT